jgi:hypothetical protein
VPLARAHEIYRDAIAQVSGLARAARGPVMSTSPGKVCVDGILDLGDRRAFVLRYLQARDAGLVGRPFLAAYDPLRPFVSPSCDRWSGQRKPYRACRPRSWGGEHDSARPAGADRGVNRPSTSISWMLRIAAGS